MQKITIYCQHCGKKINPDKSERELNMISEDPKLGEVIATCNHCQHKQRIAIFDQEQVDLILQRKELQKRIRIAQKGMEFRKSLFRQKKYKDMLQEDNRLKNKLKKRSIALMKVAESAEAMKEGSD